MRRNFHADQNSSYAYLNQGFLPAGESVTEQLETLGIKPQDLEFVILTHLHTDHASGLRQLKDAKKFLVSEEELLDTKKIPDSIREMEVMLKNRGAS